MNTSRALIPDDFTIRLGRFSCGEKWGARHTFVELCTNPESTEDKAISGISVALEMLGLNQKQIEVLMAAPLPEISPSKPKL